MYTKLTIFYTQNMESRTNCQTFSPISAKDLTLPLKERYKND
jgi:hypothetical protein